MTTSPNSQAQSSANRAELWGPSALFFLFVLAGAAYILVAKAAGTRQAFVTFVPVAFMLAYAVVIAASRFMRLRDDQAGDNLYYMGFLFTLTSLGTSLYQFSSSGDADYIVQNFGIAIATTITGIALRVFFNQMRRDPAEVERVARLELAQAARRLRAELDGTVLEFNHFRRSATQSLREGFDEIRTHVDDVSRGLLSGLEAMAAKSAAPLEAASKRSGTIIDEIASVMTDSLGASAKQLSQETDRLAQNAAAISSSLEAVCTRLGAMKSPDEIIQIKLEPTLKGLGAAVDRFAKRVEQHENGIESIRVGNQATADLLKASASQLEQASRESHVIIQQNLPVILRAVEELSTSILSLRIAAGDETGRLEAVMQQVNQHLGVISSAASESQRELMQRWADAHSGASEQRAEQTHALTQLISVVEQGATSVKQAVERTAGEPVWRREASL